MNVRNLLSGVIALMWVVAMWWWGYPIMSEIVNSTASTELRVFLGVLFIGVSAFMILYVPMIIVADDTGAV